MSLLRIYPIEVHLWVHQKKHKDAQKSTSHNGLQLGTTQLPINRSVDKSIMAFRILGYCTVMSMDDAQLLTKLRMYLTNRNI